MLHSCPILVDVAERVFNQCTTRNVNNPDALNYQITFNYEFLDDMYADWREVSDTGSDAMSTLGMCVSVH